MSRGYWETLSTTSGDGTALTAAARASLLQGAGGKTGLYTLTPNKLRINDVLWIRASGRISSVITTPGTARFDLSAGVGGTALMDTLGINLVTAAARTTVPWVLDMMGTVRLDGNAGNMIWQGYWLSDASLNTAVASTGPGPGGATLPWNTPPVVGSNWDMTVATIIDFNWTQTVATGSCTCHQFMLALLTSSGY